MGPSWDLEADDVLEMPLDDLALTVLRNFRSDGDGNSYNWMLQAQKDYANGEEVMAALDEAWAWLHARGLVASVVLRHDSPHTVKITRAGQRALEEGLGESRAVERLHVDLHHVLEAKVRHLFLVGRYDTAVLEAFRQVEIRVRKMIRAKSSLVGVPLMQEAFRKDGPFWSEDVDSGEQIARMELFKGAIGFLKNPPSHQEPTQSS